MSLPDPTPGLVIGYAYLWRDEARSGQEEGRKDRPCVIILSVQTLRGETVVTVAPITHAPPSDCAGPGSRRVCTIDNAARHAAERGLKPDFNPLRLGQIDEPEDEQR